MISVVWTIRYHLSQALHWLADRLSAHDDVPAYMRVKRLMEDCERAAGTAD